MASIRKRRRAKGTVYLVDYFDAGGQRHRLTAKNKSGAEALLAEKITETRDGPALPREAEITVDEYAARWLCAAATNLKPRTVQSYRQLFRCHISPALGGSNCAIFTARR